ncbi:MAG: ATP-binding protein [Bacteroidetes bacterium]|nr:ATP-binding protein [Bacteroidota bacterium]
MITRTTYLDKITPFINKPLIKVISGIRRSGKSTLLKLIRNKLIEEGNLENQILYINFESFVFSDITNAKQLYNWVLEQKHPSLRTYILLDEIQEILDWEKAVNSFMVDFDVDIYLTGSNSHLLSSELSTYLTGRYIEIPIYPLSYKEFIEFNEALHLSIPKEDTLNYYIRMGGFPIIHLMRNDQESAYKIIRDIYSSVILRDTIQRFGIRDVELLERVIKYAFSNIGNTFSGKNVADYFKSQQRKLDINTVYNYLNALESAFILYRVPRYDIKGKELLKTQEKFYLSDVSLLYATMGYKDRLIGGVLENLIFLELKRRDYSVSIGKFDQTEIDFIGEKDGLKIYIQVAYQLKEEQTIQREFSNLSQIKDHYPKYVISMDSFWKDNIEGIKHVYLSDFLLADYW